jgi:hypothetical protein
LALASLTGGGRSVGLDPHGLLRQGLLLLQSVDANFPPCRNTYHERYRCGGEFACIVNLCSTQKLRLTKKQKIIPHYFLDKIYMKRIGVSVDMLERKQKPAPALN